MAGKQPGRYSGRYSGSKPPGSLYRKGGRWYWRVKLPGAKRYKALALIPTGKRYATRSRPTALAVRRRLWQEHVKAAEQGGPANDLTGWLREFHAVNAYEFSARVAHRNATIIREFAAAHKLDHPGQITTEQIQQYLIRKQRSGLAPATVHKHRNALRKFCRFLLARNVLDVNPADKDLVAVPRIYHPPPRYLTDEQASAFLAAVRESPVCPAMLIALRCGLRLGEIMALRGRDISADHITVGSSGPTKTYAWRVVPLPDDVAAAMPSTAPDEPIFPRWTTASYVQHLRRLTAPLPVFGELTGRRTGNQWHLLRSTWAVNCARRGATLWQLMAWGGWRTPQTVMRYVNIARIMTDDRL